MKKLLVILFVFVLSQTSLISAQQSLSSQDTADLYSLSLLELRNIKVTAATKTEVSLRETPGIVTVITQEEIEASGARDFIDVLRLVPGFEFGQDASNVASISMRGLWAAEGKVLVTMDGQELNDNLFASTVFGGHYDVTQIKRIEIIRGPGSSIYGGSAELGVINIINLNRRQI